jgi:peptidoglycan hydrolase-like protein with peptidoglycan-binding domain
MTILKTLAAATLIAAGALPARASDLALILGNRDYRDLPDLSSGDAPLDGAETLRRAGATVLSGRDVTLERLRALSAQFVGSASKADGLVVVLSGRFLTNGQDTYFLPIESTEPSLVDAPRQALPLSVVLSVLAQSEGPAFLGLASDPRSGQPSAFMTRGIGAFEPPSNVAVVTGTPRAMAGLLREGLTRSDRSLAQTVRNSRELSALAPLPDRAPFLTASRNPGTTGGGTEEQTRWAVAQELDTADGYQLYLRRYPDGAHAAEARARIEFLRGAPERRAEQAEADLNLTRDQRREIQRDLSILGYDTRGIDGIFGRGTRAAIQKFQQRQGFETTSYLTQPQIRRLDDLAATRAAELRREAEARRQEQERHDNEVWRRIGGQSASAADIRSYLKEFPDGLHEDEARTRLSELEAQSRRQAADAERRAWDRARQDDSVAAYRTYLSDYPDGSFAFEAQSRIDDLRVRAEAEQAARASAAAETQLGLNPITRRLIEERLSSLGLDPGPVDGSFDDETRRALRRYQQQSGIEVSGFLNEPTVVRLLADSVRSLLK